MSTHPGPTSTTHQPASTAPQLTLLRDTLADPAKPPSSARAWRAVRELAGMTGPGTEGALELAARFAGIAEPASDKLLKLWAGAADRDEFARLLLAPAFARENRAELDLGRKLTLEGVRHLTTLRQLRAYQRKDITDLGELAGLGRLSVLDLDGCRNVADLSPLAGLTELTVLNLHHTAVGDLSPLAGLSGLTELNLEQCTAVTDLTPLRGLTGLTSLRLARTGIADLPALTMLLLGETSPDLDPAGLRGRAPFTSITTAFDHQPRWQAAISEAIGKPVRMVDGWLVVAEEPVNETSVNEESVDKEADGQSDGRTGG